MSTRSGMRCSKPTASAQPFEAMENIAVKILKSIKMTLDQFDGLCGELANEVLHEYPEAQILYIESERDSYIESVYGYIWSYHMVPVIDGYVHDAWHPNFILPVDEYINAVFTYKVQISLEPPC